MGREIVPMAGRLLEVGSWKKALQSLPGKQYN